jgi:Protein of unknown function (DUF2867)
MRTMTIIKSTLPGDSLLNVPGDKYDYVDCYQGHIVDKQNKISPTDIGNAFFSSAPEWVDKLFGLRNNIVGLFGLKNSQNRIARQKIQDISKFEKGDQIGFFKLFDKTNKEIILGEDDKHLNFRVSLFMDEAEDNRIEKHVTISTLVIFNNWFGRIYFLPVRSFHKLIVPAMLKAMIKQLETKIS